MVLHSLLATGLALALAVTPAMARTLSVSAANDPSTLDPLSCADITCSWVLRNVYEGLTRIDRTGSIQPALALRWELHDDNLGWTFHLRPGVKFHSGRLLTAADVKFTFEHTRSDQLKHVIGATEMREGKATGLAGIRVIDELTLEIRFSRPDVLFPHYEFRIVDAEAVRQTGAASLNRISAGTGPFAVKHHKRGVEVALSAHQGYWAGAARIEGVRFLIVPKEETALNQYEAGELDVVPLWPATAARVRRDRKLASEMIFAPSAGIRYIGLSPRAYPPFADKRIREAVCRAIDRDAVVKGFARGLGQPLYGAVSPISPGANPDVDKAGFDLVHARRLLVEAGYPEGKGLPPLVLAAPAGSQDEAIYFADHLARALGLETKVEIAEFGTFFKSLKGGKVAFIHWGRTPSYVDPHGLLSQMWVSDSPFNFYGYSNPSFDRLIERAAATVDNDARYAIYHEAERILLDDWAFCGTFVRTQTALVRSNTKGVEYGPTGLLPFTKVSID